MCEKRIKRHKKNFVFITLVPGVCFPSESLQDDAIIDVLEQEEF